MRLVALTRISIFAGLPVAILACALPAAAVRAESLTQAFAAAYRYNPTIDSRRARLRALDEGVSIARSGYRPRIAATGSASWDRTIPNLSGATVVGAGGGLTTGGDTRTTEYGLELSQSVFTGLQVTNRVRAAESLVRAGREELRNAEQVLFLSVLSAYTDILSAQNYASLLEVAVRDATRRLRRTRARLALQETTRTDVAQAQALRADILADLAGAQGRIKTARAAYFEVVGHQPRRLVPPSIPHRRLPKSLQDAVSIATKEHPLIISALYNEQAARNTVDLVRGRLLPQVDLTASYGKSRVSDDSGTEDTTVSASVRIPIYEGGANHAAVRQAKQIHLSNLQLIAAERSRVRRAVTTTWTELEVAKKRVGYMQIRIRANKAAITGIRKEESIGQRTVNDLLVAQRELLRTQNDMLTAKRTVVIAAYRVLAEIGRLNPEQHLPSNSNVYDPTIHHEEVRRKWFGLSIVYSDGRREKLNAKMR